MVEEEPDPTLQLPVSAFIPEAYVADQHQRLSLYKRLTSCAQVGRAGPVARGDSGPLRRASGARWNDCSK